MTDSDHAKAVKDAASALDSSLKAAGEAGLDCAVDTQTVYSLTIGDSKQVSIWSVTATVARPL